MDNLIQDLRFTLRTLVKSPAVSLAAILSLGLGIGANTSIFTLVRAVLLNPLPVEDPGRLVAVYTQDEAFAGGPRGSHFPTSHPNFEDLRDNNSVFEYMAAYQSTPMAMLIGGEPEEVIGEAVSSDYFTMLGIQPVVGRLFSPEENGVDTALPVVVLSQSLWQRQFGGKPDISGEKLLLNGQPFTVIGVVPQGFIGVNLSSSPELWVPLQMRNAIFAGPLRDYFDDRRALMFWVIGRLKEGVSLEVAETALGAIFGGLVEDFPEVNDGRSLTLLPLMQSNILPHQRKPFVLAGGLLMVVVALVLLIACANVAHLLMVRAENRRKEITLRLALGSSRSALVRQLLVEGFVLAVCGAGLGLLMAYWSREPLWSLRPPSLIHASPNLALDATVLGFTLLVTAATAILFGLGPALKASRPDLMNVLRDRLEAPGSGRLVTTRNALVAVQIALSLVSLIISGLFLASLREAQEADPGFAAEKLAVLSYNLGTQGYDAERGREFHRRVIEEVESAPEIRRAAIATNRPLNALFAGFLRTVIPEGQDTSDPDNSLLITTDAVSAGYLEALEIPLVEGRHFNSADLEGGRLVAVINETMGRRLWPDEPAIGRRFAFWGEDQLIEIVGIARDSRYQSLGEEAMPYIYLPIEQHYEGRVQLFLHAGENPERIHEIVRRKIRDLDRALPLTYVSTMPSEIDKSLWAARLGAVLTGVFGFLALVLASIGTYSLMSYSVSLRSRELGIRMALGADRGAVMKMVLRQGITVVVFGITVGWISAALLSRLLTSLLYGISVTDPATFLTASSVLAAIAMVANLIPALRATTINPISVLRS